jgi:pimeloyl-ACP methyl ester carboxylesterase
VPWARRRAALGDVVLRLDVAGIGDSARRTLRDAAGTPELYDARCVDDVARALAWLREECGVGPCTVMGVCSGAHHAWRAALADVDVQQVVAINPLIFHWRAGMSMDPQTQAFGQIAIAADAGRSLLDPQRWWKLLTGRAHVGVIAGALAARARHALRLRARELARLVGVPLVDDLAAELGRAVARGVAVHFVFSRGEPGLKLLREESGRRGLRLIRDSLVKVCAVEHADHTFAGVPGRLSLYACLDTLLSPPSVPISDPDPAPASAHQPVLRRP